MYGGAWGSALMFWLRELSACNTQVQRARRCSLDHDPKASLRRRLSGSGLSVGTENLIPEEMNCTKITIRVTVMKKVQFLLSVMYSNAS